MRTESSGSARRARPDERLARRGGGIEILRVPAALFGAVARARGALYDRGWLSVSQLDVPVLSVGNLSAGGTGKTPMVVWLARRLIARGLVPGVLARGYSSQGAGGALNDEGRMLERLLPGVQQVQDKDRVRGGQALANLGVDAIVLDDGFQHRRLYRDLDLVLLDATRPWGLAAPPGGGRPVRAFLPRGLLREAPSALARANAVVITRADDVDDERREELTATVLDLAPGVPIAFARHRPSALARIADSQRLELEWLRGREVDLISGIGNPEAFERTVSALGARVREHRAHRDHHAFAAQDLAGLGSRPVLTTAKDAVKLEALIEPAGPAGPAAIELLTLEVDMDLLSGAPVLDALIDALPPALERAQREALHAGTHG